MKKLLATLIALLMLAAAPALAEESKTVGDWIDGAVSSVDTWISQSGQLEVRGQAVRTVAPDTVSLRVGASVEKDSEKDAQDGANEIINKLIERLRALGVEDSQIVTSGYNVTRRTHRSSRLVQQEDTFVARISLRVTVQDFDLINKVLDAARDVGANEIGSISFSYSDEGEVYRQALADAILAAKAKAEIMAETAGVRLYTLISLREGSSGGVYVNSYEAPMAAGAGEMSEDTVSAQIMSGEIEVSAHVTLIYQTK